MDQESLIILVNSIEQVLENLSNKNIEKASFLLGQMHVMLQFEANKLAEKKCEDIQH